MEQEKLIELYNKFPVILKEKLCNGEVKLPANTLFFYEKFLAYRGIARDKDDHTPVNANDMKSYFEQGKKPRGRRCDETDPGLYSVSLFVQLDEFKNTFKFPRPGKKVAQGYISQEGGPQCTSEESSHVHWWLYENVDFGEFEIKEELDG